MFAPVEGFDGVFVIDGVGHDGSGCRVLGLGFAGWFVIGVGALEGDVAAELPEVAEA